MKQKKYDIFISYRRSSYDTANLIATRLKSAGYSVFFDMETLRSGKFNVQLYNVIESCTDFLLVLPPGALDRCVNEDDWVRLEIQHAMTHKKNIIPVMLNGFKWPDEMPQGLEELSEYQALTASSIEYFDMAMESLQKRYLQSKPHFMYQKLAKYIMVCVALFMVVMALLWGVFMFLSRDVCISYATRLVNDAQSVYILAEENAIIKNEWKEYEDAFKYGTPDATLKRMQNDLLGQIDLTEKHVRKAWLLVDTLKMDIGSYHSFLLSINGVNAQEISLSPMYSSLMFEDYINCLEYMRFAVEEPTFMNVRHASAYLAACEYSINAYYASTLSELSRFPDYSLKLYNKCKESWVYFPSHYEFGKDEEYYIDIATKEMKLAENALDAIESQLDRAESELDDFLRDNNTSGALNDKMKELDGQVVALYEGMKEKTRFKDGDGLMTKWLNCCFMGYMVPMLAMEQQQMCADGYNFRFSVTPEMACDETVRMLDMYESEFPESKVYVASAKTFFRTIAKGGCEYAGVIVYAIKDNATHPSLRVGDIICEFDGARIMSREDLKTAYSNNNDGNMKVYRNVNGTLEKVNLGKLTDSDIVGFLDLVVEPE